MRVVTVVDTTAEVNSEAQHAPYEPASIELAQMQAPKVEVLETPQLARAVEAYARVQRGLPHVTVGRYLRVQA